MSDRLRHAKPIWFGMLFILLGIYNMPTDFHNLYLSLNDKAWITAMTSIGWHPAVKYYDYGVMIAHFAFIIIGVFIIINRDRKLSKKDGD